jgi:hypothetical protein
MRSIFYHTDTTTSSSFLAPSSQCAPGAEAGKQVLTPAPDEDEMLTPTPRGTTSPRLALTTGYYEYKPFTTDTSIRILALLPAEKEDRIECQLSIIERDQAPPYKALSYAWGRPTDTRLIVCGGKKLKIPANLRNALWRIRDPAEIQLLWADAVCINQSDEQERGHQVKYMGSIYSNAEQILVWLGSDASDVFDCFDDAKEFEEAEALFDTIYAAVDSINSQEPSMQVCSNVPRFQLGDLDHDACYAWTTFAKLLDRPWFSRLWVVQEVGLGKSVIALFGDARMEFDDLMWIAHWLRSEAVLADYFSINTHYSSVFSIFPARYKETVHESGWDTFDFLELLVVTSTQLASDPRDYIYALLGHPRALIGGVPIVEPDYRKTVSALFLEVAIKLIDDTKSLRVLSAVRHRNESDLEEEYASWVPKWNRDGFSNSIGTNGELSICYDSEAGSSTFWNRITSGNVLHVRGFVFDVIDEYSGTVEFDERRGSFENHNVDCWQIQAAMRFNSRSTYSVGERLSDIAQTLTTGIKGNQRSHKESPVPVLADFAAFRLHLIKQASRRGGVAPSDLAPEGLAAIQATARGGDSNRFFNVANDVCLERKLFSTRHGMLGLGPRLLREGDLCCILFGATIPFILRPLGQQYRLVGEAYVHPLIYGEEMVRWISAERRRNQVFEIF